MVSGTTQIVIRNICVTVRAKSHFMEIDDAGRWLTESECCKLAVGCLKRLPKINCTLGVGLPARQSAKTADP